MKIQINSTNMASWCDGPNGIISPHTYSTTYDNSPALKRLENIGTVPQVKEFLNDPDNFANEQEQLISMIHGYAKTTEAYCNENEIWEKLKMLCAATMGLTLTFKESKQFSYDFLETKIMEGVIERDPHNGARREFITFEYDDAYFHKGRPKEYAHLIDYILFFCTDWLENNRMNFIPALSHNVYKFVRKPSDMVEWTVAGYIGTMILVDLAKKGLLGSASVG